QQTFSDGALSLITLGIYSPHTIKVWCQEQVLGETL
ncbi:MAG: Bor/Iss family lipoprotein, partial [Pseudoalteromonas sp.]